jgi:hypothetical protein
VLWIPGDRKLKANFTHTTKSSGKTFSKWILVLERQVHAGKYKEHP